MDITLPSGAVFDFGDTPEEQVAEELTNLRTSNPELFQESMATEPQSEGPPNPVTTPYSELKAYYDKNPSGSAESQEPDIIPTIDGDITDIPTRFAFGKRDTAEEKEQFLTETYGPGSFGKDRSGRYYLELDNISPEIKAEKNLSDSGTMWFNKPGGGFLGLFDMGDLSDFTGKYRGELIGGTAAALATTGVGLLPASILIGLGAGLGKGVDELQEVVEGTQLQPTSEIVGDVATAAAFNSLGNLVVGGTLKLLGRVIKGSGNPDAQVISDLIATGMSPGQAKAAAVQIQRTQTRDAIKAGASPTISDATGKAILGRMQAIHEGIFPNRKAARANRTYVENLIKQYRNGDLSDGAFGAALDQNAKDVSALISQSMKNPSEAVKLANQHLRDVIEEEMNILKQVYTTGDETAAVFQGEMTRMVRLWQNNNKELYDNASTLLDDAKLFRSNDLKELVGRQIEAPLAAEQGLANNPVYQYIINKEGDFTLSELQALRSTVNNSRSGDLVGDVADHQLKGLSEKLDEMFDSANVTIQQKMADLKSGQMMSYKTLGVDAPAGRNSGQIISKEEAAELARKFADGFDLYKGAQAHYADGAEIFKTGAMNMLNQNIKEGFFADLSSIAESVIQNGKPELLKNYLRAVTPDETVRGTLQAIPETQWSEMANAAKSGNITEVNRLLGANFPELAGSSSSNEVLRKVGISFKPPKFLETLSENDPYRIRVLKDLADTFTVHAEDSAAAATGISHKNISREMLANTWMKTAIRESETSGVGVFDPVKFRVSFDRLGAEVQTELFGAAEAKRLNSVLKDFALVAPDQVKGGYRFASAAPESINNSTMRNIASNLQSDVAEAQAQSTNALFQAVKSGNIVDADSLVQAAVKDPKLLDDLIAAVPDDAINQPFGLRDATMSRIIRQAFPDGVTEDAVVSGAWQDGMAGAIANLNQRGSLNKILGPETVQDLIKLTKLSVGDQALKGKGGLASSAYAAGIGMRILAEPVSGLTSVAAIFASGRILRNPTFLKLMTRPNIRASELKNGIRALTDDIMAKARADGLTITRKQANDAAKQQFGNLSVLRRRFTELAAADARLIASTKASESTGPEQRQAVGQAISGAASAARPVVQNIQQQLPAAAAQVQQMNPLRQVEQNKLLGIGANQ